MFTGTHSHIDSTTVGRSTHVSHTKYWLLNANVVPIPGSKNRARILENLGVGEVMLSDEEFAALQNALDGIKVFGHRGQVEYDGDTMKDWNR